MNDGELSFKYNLLCKCVYNSKFMCKTIIIFMKFSYKTT